MEEIAPAALLGLVVFNLTNFVRYLLGKDWNGAVTNAAVWVVGWLVALAASASTVLGTFTLPGFSEPLGSMNAVDLMLVAPVIGALAHTANEAFGAFDRTRSTSKPHLVEPSDHS